MDRKERESLAYQKFGGRCIRMCQVRKLTVGLLLVVCMRMSCNACKLKVYQWKLVLRSGGYGVEGCRGLCSFAL